MLLFFLVSFIYLLFWTKLVPVPHISGYQVFVKEFGDIEGITPKFIGLAFTKNGAERIIEEHYSKNYTEFNKTGWKAVWYLEPYTIRW